MTFLNCSAVCKRPSVLHRVEPDAHGIVRPEFLDVADARDGFQFIHEVLGSIVLHERRIIRAIGGNQGEDHSHGTRRLLDCNAGLGNFNSRNDDVSLTIAASGLACLGSNNILIAARGLYPTLGSNEISALFKGDSNLNISGLGRIRNIQIATGEDDGLTGQNMTQVLVIGIIVGSGSFSSGTNLNSHSHGANHDDSQYQCEYFFHCDFLL